MAERIRSDLAKLRSTTGRIAENAREIVSRAKIPPVVARAYVHRDGFESAEISQRRRSQFAMLGSTARSASQESAVAQNAPAAAAATPATADPSKELRISWNAPDLMERVNEFVNGKVPAKAAPKTSKRRAAPKARDDQFVQATPATQAAIAPKVEGSAPPKPASRPSSVEIDYGALGVQDEPTHSKTPLIRPAPARGFTPMVLRASAAARRAWDGLVSTLARPGAEKA